MGSYGPRQFHAPVSVRERHRLRLGRRYVSRVRSSSEPAAALAMARGRAARAEGGGLMEDRTLRWRNRSSSFRPAGELIRTADYDVAAIATDREAKAFVERHHYSASYPAARFRFGLYRQAELVGVAVFSVPHVAGGPRRVSWRRLELGRARSVRSARRRTGERRKLVPGSLFRAADRRRARRRRQLFRPAAAALRRRRGRVSGSHRNDLPGDERSLPRPSSTGDPQAVGRWPRFFKPRDFETPNEDPRLRLCVENPRALRRRGARRERGPARMARALAAAADAHRSPSREPSLRMGPAAPSTGPPGAIAALPENR